MYAGLAGTRLSLTLTTIELPCYRGPPASGSVRTPLAKLSEGRVLPSSASDGRGLVGGGLLRVLTHAVTSRRESRTRVTAAATPV